jgi:hypothetical protein
MSDKLLTYILVIILAFSLFLSGYYLLTLFEEAKQKSVSQKQETNEFINSQNDFTDIREKELEILTPIRDSYHLIDGEIAFINNVKTTTEISVIIDMNKNFKDSPITRLSRTFLVTENTVIYTSETGRRNETILSDGISKLKEGDLIALETEDSIVNILDDKHFFVLKLWKIIE